MRSVPPSSPFATLQHFAMPRPMAQKIMASAPGGFGAMTTPVSPPPAPSAKQGPSRDFINTVKNLPYNQILDAFRHFFPNQVPASPFDFFIRHISQNFPLPRQIFFGGSPGGGGGALGGSGGSGPGPGPGGVGISGGIGGGW